MALERLPEPPDYILTDHVRLPGLRIPQKNITKGDRLCLTISCASVIAKVVRDRIMIDADDKVPGIRFRQSQGLRHQRTHGMPCSVMALARYTVLHSAR